MKSIFVQYVSSQDYQDSAILQDQFVDDCKRAIPPHSVGVLAAVCYPGNGSTDIETLGKCGTCGEEYDINDVLLHTYKRDTSSRNGMLLIQLCKMKNFNRGHVV